MKAFVLSGGFGSRLSSVVYGKPKALAPIAEKPFLEVSLHLLKLKGFDQFILGVGYLADQIIDKFGDGSRYGFHLKYSIELQPLDTAGSVKYADHFFKKTFFVFDGNNFLDADFVKMLEFHHQHKAAMTIALTKSKKSVYKTKINKQYRIVDYGKEVDSEWLDTGFYIVEPEVVQAIPIGRKYSISNDLIPTLITKNKKIVGFETDGSFQSIRNEKLYKQTIKYFTKHLKDYDY